MGAWTRVFMVLGAFAAGLVGMGVAKALPKNYSLQLRYAADRRTLLWVTLMFVVVSLQYWRPELIWYMFPLTFYFALAAGVLSHNHNHCPTFKSRRANNVFGHILSLFYGYPTFAWVPTHNLNHHRFVNRAGDATITWRYTNKNNFLVLATYFFVSGYFQSNLIKTYIRKARVSNRPLFYRILFQYSLWAGTAVALLLLAAALHGWKTGLFMWGMVTVGPSVYALWGIMAINYLQHVHTDPWSAHNHSRNFTGPGLNFLLFNNGYHAAHHEGPGTHWSELSAAHAKIEAEIHPELKQRNAFWFLLKTYFLSPFFPRFKTEQIGRAPFDPPDGSPMDLTCADVPLGEAGSNATMVRGEVSA